MPPRFSSVSTVSTPVEAAKPFMTPWSSEPNSAPWINNADRNPSSAAPKSPGRAGTRSTTITSTSTGGRSSRGCMTKLALRVSRVSCT